MCPIRIRNPDRSQGVFDPAMEKSYPVAKVKDPDPDPVENRPDTVHCLHVKIFLLTIITFILTPFGKQTLSEIVCLVRPGTRDGAYSSTTAKQ